MFACARACASCIVGFSRFVFDATTDNFRTLVLENSHKGPVLVNYWSPRAGPCMMLMPRLVRLCSEYGVRFLLVMLKTDELGRLAKEQGVVTLPTIKVYRGGRAVDTLHGAESEANLRRFIDKHVAVFTLLGGDDPRVREYQTLLQTALH